MKKKFLVLAAVVTATVTTIVAVSCKRNFDQGANFTPRATAAATWYNLSLPEHNIPQVISSNMTLSDTALWILDGKVYVTNGATLTIESNTFVAAKKKSTNDSASALIVTRGSKLNANGTSSRPITFTSYNSCPSSGDWGGVVLLGRASLNRADTTIEGINLPSVPAGVDIRFGGGGPCTGNDNDTSGTLKFVRIEYAGASIAANNELNGLTCGGVGRGTVLDNIEVAYGADDAFEFFGGTVNASHLIALAPDDDAFDFDFGYQGAIQFAVSILNPGPDQCGAPIDYSSSANGIESSSNPTCTNACKQTRPVISNMTVIGFSDSTAAVTAPHVLRNGALFNQASGQVVRNSLFMGFPNGVRFDCQLSIDSAIRFQNNTVQGFQTTDIPNVLDATNREIRSNPANAAAINLTDPSDACSPDFRPIAGSTLLTDPVNYTGLPSFIVAKTYRGACSSGFGIDAQWPNQPWVKYNYPPYCSKGSCCP